MFLNHKWLRQFLSKIKLTTDDNKEKYKFGDHLLIQIYTKFLELTSWKLYGKQ